MPDTMYAAPVVPGPDGARRGARWPALPSRVIWPVDLRVAWQLELETRDARRARSR